MRVQSSAPILPGATIGVLGSGQLGRMFALAARRMGYRVHTFSPETDTPTGQVADLEIVGDYGDLDAVRAFACHVDVVSFEFENVPSPTTEAVAEFVPVRPAGSVLHTTQNRLREKTFLVGAGLPVTPFRSVTTRAELESALNELGYPSVLKTAGFGYDGKGQWTIRAAREADAAFEDLGGQPAVLEAFVDFAGELSVIGARGVNGDFAYYGPVWNTHRNHILDVTVAPAPGISPETAKEAVAITRAVLEGLNVVGVLCVEFFLTTDARLLINELAPRPHNSGHYTIEGCVTSQFEQQLRAVCGLPLGSTEMVRPAAAMLNILGDLWPIDGSPNWPAVCALPEVKLHLYGKQHARVGRKMGHVTALADTPAEAEQLVRAARGALRG